MASTPVTTIQNGQIIPVLNVNDADFEVLAHVILASMDNGNVFSLYASNHDLLVRGSVSGGPAIRLGDDLTFVSDINNRLEVTDTGDVHGAGIAVQVYGSASTVLNRGTIWGGSVGVVMVGTGTVTNHGAIRGDGTGIEVVAKSPSASPATIMITNGEDGLVSGWEFGILAIGDAGDRVRVTNDGTIVGHQLGSLTGGEAELIVTNRGLMAGHVSLGFGDDVFSNVGGEVIGGIACSDGLDRVLPGGTEETIDGGTGFDTLDFRTSAAGVRVSLLDADGSANTGRAKNDTYTAFENIWGSSKGGDTLIGDGNDGGLTGYGGADRLEGRGGEDNLNGGAGIDRLLGGEGADNLTGGAGVDTLTGGPDLGSDTFYFAKPSEGGDIIQDFEVLDGDDDSIVIGVAGFGGNLVAGGMASDAQHRIRANANTATTLQERFIFRDSDDTLWFDEDGLGGTGPVLIADLQDGATVEANDIMLG